MFDLPTITKEDRARYRLFHDFLEDDGFEMMQFSIYIRHCASEENAVVHMNRVKAALPQEGEVRMIAITDKQFGRIQVYQGQLPRKAEEAPKQVGLF